MTVENRKLKPGTKYEVALILVNEFKGTKECHIYSIVAETLGADGTKKATKAKSYNYFWLLCLLLLIPLVVIIYLIVKRYIVTDILVKKKK